MHQTQGGKTQLITAYGIRTSIWASLISVAFVLCFCGSTEASPSKEKALKSSKTNKITAKKTISSARKNSGSGKGASGKAVKTAALDPQKTASQPEPVAAKTLFGAVRDAAPLSARAIGSYAKGCLAGGKMLPVDGPAWQAMRLSRNRNWGHPKLVKFVERLALDAKEKDKWPGLLVGDLAQPRGGPMLSGHSSHQIGLDADIWLTPMPSRILSTKEREEMAATTMLNADTIGINPKVWTDGHVKLLKRAASYPDVARIFVHPAIKKALCTSVSVKKMVEVKVLVPKEQAQAPTQNTKSQNTHATPAKAGEKVEITKLVETVVIPEKEQAWLSRIRPWWGHHYHFHVRINCPAGSVGCENQPKPADDDGCGKELETWIKRVSVKPKYPAALLKPAPAKSQLTLSDLPKECVAVLGPDNLPTAIAKQDTSKTLPALALGSSGAGQITGAQQTHQLQTIPGVQMLSAPDIGKNETRQEAPPQPENSLVKDSSTALPIPDKKPLLKSKTGKVTNGAKPVKKKNTSQKAGDHKDHLAAN